MIAKPLLLIIVLWLCKRVYLHLRNHLELSRDKRSECLQLTLYQFRKKVFI